MALAPAHRLRVNFFVQLEAGRVLFVRISEDADAVEFDGAHELDHLLKIFFALAGEADDKSRAHGDTGDALADARDQSLVGRACAAAPHALQDPAAGVL